MTKELEKETDIPCTKCIFKGKCPSENKEEVYKICKEIKGAEIKEK
jgi:hypothetical protein